VQSAVARVVGKPVRRVLRPDEREAGVSIYCECVLRVITSATGGPEG
jgi:hypothetical protein